MHKISLVVIRPDGVTAGPRTSFDLSEEIVECRMLRHQMVARANAEAEAVNALSDELARLGGVTPGHSFILAQRSAWMREIAYLRSAMDYGILIQQLEALLERMNQSAGV